MQKRKKEYNLNTATFRYIHQKQHANLTSFPFYNFHSLIFKTAQSNTHTHTRSQHKQFSVYFGHWAETLAARTNWRDSDLFVCFFLPFGYWTLQQILLLSNITGMHVAVMLRVTLRGFFLRKTSAPKPDARESRRQKKNF